jgi:histone deacetylase complex regulatory component SIN3
MRELRVEDALMYLDQVKMEFGDRPQIYNEFLDIMKNFKSQQIDTPGVIERVSNLFHGNKKLVLGFNTFLPEGYKIELPIDGAPAVFRAPGQIGVTQIRTHAYNLPGAQQAAAQAAQQAHARAQTQQQAAQANAHTQAHAQQQAQAQGASPMGGPSQAAAAAVMARAPFPGSQRGPGPGSTSVGGTSKHSMQQQHGQGQSPSTTLTPGNTGLALAPVAPNQGPGPLNANAQVGASSLSARARLAAAEKQGRAMAEQVKMHQQAARNSQLPSLTSHLQQGGPGRPSSQQSQKHPSSHPQLSSVPPSFARAALQQAQGQQKQPPALQQQRSQQRAGPGQPHPSSQQQQAQAHGQQGPKQQAQAQQQEQQQQTQAQPVGGASAEQPAANQPVEFDHAINYVTTIKKRFANQPDTYKNFLKILHTYQKEQRGIKEVLDEVSELFSDHPDLLQEFTYFLPDAVQATAKVQLAAAVKVAQERKRLAAERAAKQVAEARTQAILKAKIAARERERPPPSVQPPPIDTVTAPAPPPAPPSASGPIPGGMPFPPRRQTLPPPVPFGAAVGRSEEREKEICRNAQYGTVSFAPVRPPKK